MFASRIQVELPAIYRSAAVSIAKTKDIMAGRLYRACFAIRLAKMYSTRLLTFALRAGYRDRFMGYLILRLIRFRSATD